jgi:hypothetical protein
LFSWTNIGIGVLVIIMFVIVFMILKSRRPH